MYYSGNSWFYCPSNTKKKPGKTQALFEYI